MRSSPRSNAKAFATPVISKGFVRTDCAASAEKRFGKVAEAKAWIESQIGPAPKKPTWAVIVQTYQSGTWPVKATTSCSRSKALSETKFEERLTSLETKLDQRLQRIEWLLAMLSETNAKHQASPDQQDSHQLQPPSSPSMH